MTREEIAKKVGLSKEQERAVLLESSSAIIAGAGSGKTTTMATSIVADLLADNISPEDICATTFTKSAAANLSEKIITLSEEMGYRGPIEKMTIGTIDSLLLEIVQENALQTNMSPAIQIGSESELERASEAAWEKTKNTLAEEGPEKLRCLSRIFSGKLDFNSKKIHSFLDLSKKSENFSDPEIFLEKIDDLIADLEKEYKKTDNHNVKNNIEKIVGIFQTERPPFKPDIVAKSLKNHAPLLADRIEMFCFMTCSLSLEPERDAVLGAISLYLEKYQEIKSSLEIADYRDIEKEAEKLIFAPGFSDLFSVIYLDEAQDTSISQQEIMKNLLVPDGKIIVIGDIRQSIYSWRKASPESFAAWIDELGSVELTANYRSSESIVDAVNQISKKMPYLKNDYKDMNAISKEKGHVSFKMIINTKKEGGRAPSRPASDEIEAPAIAKTVKDYINENEISPEDVCVISRTNNRVDLISKELRLLGFKVEAFFSKNPFESDEAAAPLAILSLFADPENDEALTSLLSSPMFFLRPDEIEYLSQTKPAGQSLLFSLNDSGNPDLERFLDIFLRLYKNKNNYRLIERIWFLLGRFEYFSTIKGLDSTGGGIKILDSVFETIEEIESRTGPVARLVLKETDISIKKKNEYSKESANSDSIKTMTIHNAKGLEFPSVVYTDLGYMPMSGERDPVIIEGKKLGLRARDIKNFDFFEIEKKNKTREDKEEERCVYVGLTRAEENLLVIARGWFSKKRINFSSLADPVFCQSDFSFAVDGDSIYQSSGDIDIGGSLFSAEIILPRLFEKEELEEKEPPNLGRAFLFDSKKEDFYKEGLSYTKLSEWEICSMKRFIENDLGLRKPSSIDLGSDSSGAREKGIKIHNNLALIDWNDRFSLLEKEIPFKEDTEKFLRSDAAGIIDSFVGDKRPEAQFEFQIKGQRIRGVFDFILIGKNEVVIIDWKTGVEKDFSLQEEIYAWAGFLISPDADCVKTVWQFQDHSVEKIFSDKAKLKNILEKKIENIFNKDPLPIANNLAEARENPLCYGCPGLGQICPVSDKNKK